MSILDTGDVVSFLIRRCGEGTKLLTSLRAGDAVSIIGPVGVGWGKPRGEGRLLMVAGGVGLAPLLFAARSLGGEASPPPVTMLYGARRAEEGSLPFLRHLVMNETLVLCAALLVLTLTAGIHG